MQNVQALATVPPSSKLQNANCSMESLHSEKLLSGEQIANCKLQHVVCPVENGANKAENKSKQGSLKFRFKVVPDINTKKNVALYDGLGLVGSPSTSFGSSSEESEGQPSLSGRGSNLSSADILQVNEYFLFLLFILYVLQTYSVLHTVFIIFLLIRFVLRWTGDDFISGSFW